MDEPWPLDAWPDVPTRYLLFADDRFFPAEFARALARERLGVTADEMPGSHCAYLSRPHELAARLDGFLK
jgi:pimeloyl-ACP methyl ester carboxylesterase